MPARIARASATRPPLPRKGRGDVRPRSWLTEPIEAKQPSSPSPDLINEDFRPTAASERTFGAVDIAALWIGLVISVPAYYLAGSLVELGMSWFQGVATVTVANALVLVPMVLNAHAGTKYGVPFPVLTRAAFGVKGAAIVALLRGLVACVWFGIQTWVGGSSLLTLWEALVGPAQGFAPLALIGITAPQLFFFLAFWAIQVAILVKGIESIRVVEKYSAPILIALSAALLAWAVTGANGFGPMLSTPSKFASSGDFWKVFLPSVTANVGFWSTLSLNIPDFTRFATSQRAQLVGQAVGLPVFMALFSFLGVAVTSATLVIFGTAITDPVQVVSKIGGVLPLSLSLIGLMLATISTNIAANVVAPANALVALAPQRISFVKGSIITAILGIVTQPWRLLSSTQGYIFTWLIGYSALLGPVAGILIADYFLVRKRVMDVDALYSGSTRGAYWYSGGYNKVAFGAMALGVAPNLPGFIATIFPTVAVPALFTSLYSGAWFVGFLISLVAYAFIMEKAAPGIEPTTDVSELRWVGE